MNEKTIAILIPCLNEELSIAQVIHDFKREIPEAVIYVYDNNSTDKTAEIATREGAIVQHAKKRGKANTVLKMFSEIDADIYVMIDGDDTYPVNKVNDLINALEVNQADMVVGDRLSNLSYQKENKRPFHQFGNQLVKNLINRFFHSNLKDILSGYRVFNQKFVKNYATTIGGFELETDLTIYCLNYNFSIVEVPIKYKDRTEGSHSKLNTFSDGFKVLSLFFNLFRLYKPLYFFGIISSIFLILGLGLGVFPIYDYLQYQYVYRVPTAIAAVTLVLMSLLFFICGLILDNISKIDRKNFKLNLLHYELYKK